jgi:hypothetical protein
MSVTVRQLVDRLCGDHDIPLSASRLMWRASASSNIGDNGRRYRFGNKSR